MKNIFLFLAVSATLIFTSCEGPEGPQGETGGLVYGQVFETTVDFNAGNNFSQLITIPTTIEVYESDVVLVYLLSDLVSDGDGGTIDVWSQLPQTYFVPQGTLLYTFDHTFLDVNLLLDGNFDLTTLGSEFTNNQTFRIAIVPAEFATANLTMEQLIQGLQIEATDIEQISK